MQHDDVAAKEEGLGQIISRRWGREGGQDLICLGNEECNRINQPLAANVCLFWLHVFFFFFLIVYVCVGWG